MSKIRIPHEYNHPLTLGLNQPMKRGTFCVSKGYSLVAFTDSSKSSGSQCFYVSKIRVRRQSF